MKLSDLAALITSDTKLVVEDESGDIYEEYVGNDIYLYDPYDYLSREIVNISSGYYQIGVMIR
jgi:hypothetical protein